IRRRLALRRWSAQAIVREERQRRSCVGTGAERAVDQRSIRGCRRPAVTGDYALLPDLLPRSRPRLLHGTGGQLLERVERGQARLVIAARSSREAARSALGDSFRGTRRRDDLAAPRGVDGSQVIVADA